MVVVWVVAALFGAAFGAVLASFGCVVGERGFAGAVAGRSRCVCGRQLSARENVPVLGWLAARGRASCCNAAIPVRYLWCELFGVGVGAGAGVGTVAAASGALVWVAGAVALCVGVPAAVCARARSR